MNQAIHEALAIISGGKSGGYYLAGFFFSFLVIAVSIWAHSLKRDIDSPATPRKYSVWFLVWDNAKRAIAGLVCMFIFYRIFDLSDVKAMVAVGSVMSFGVDKAIELLIENTPITNFLKTNRENFEKQKTPTDEQ